MESPDISNDLLTIRHIFINEMNQSETTPVDGNQPEETMNVVGEEEEEEEEEDEEEDEEEEDENDQISGNGQYVDLVKYMLQSPVYHFGVRPGDEANEKLYQAVCDAYENPYSDTEEIKRAKVHFNTCQIEKCFVCIQTRALFIDTFEPIPLHSFLYSHRVKELNEAMNHLTEFKERLDHKCNVLGQYIDEKDLTESCFKMATVITLANNINVIIAVIYHKFNERRLSISRQNSIFDVSKIEILPNEDEKTTKRCDICQENCHRFVNPFCLHQVCIACYGKMLKLSYYQCPFCKFIGNFASLVNY